MLIKISIKYDIYEKFVKVKLINNKHSTLLKVSYIMWSIIYTTFILVVFFFFMFDHFLWCGWTFNSTLYVEIKFINILK